MIWCRFQNGASVSYGIVEGDTVIAVDGDPFSDSSAAHRPGIKLSDVKLLVPVLPPTFYAIGSNYRTHVIERSKAKGFKEPKFYDRPRVGYRANSALIATGDDIVKPKMSGPRFEYEGELVAVIGKRCRNVSPDAASASIFGWTIGNDLTERDWQRDDPTNLRGKNADTFKPMGPWIATGIDPRDMTTMCGSTARPFIQFPTGNMLFSAAEVISDISRTNTLSPGRGLARHRRVAAKLKAGDYDRDRDQRHRRAAQSRGSRSMKQAVMMRAKLALLLIAALFAALPSSASAQKYPSRPIRVMLPFAAGSVSDVTLRILADKLGARLNASIIVENQPRAGGTTAALSTKTATPDGYTLVTLSSSTAISVSLLKALPYDPVGDFMPDLGHQHLRQYHRGQLRLEIPDARRIRSLPPARGRARSTSAPPRSDRPTISPPTF